MPDLLLELFSEEIPARMQARAADDLRKMITDRLVDAGLVYEGASSFATPRRLALVVRNIPARQPDLREEKKGPRVGAPEQAIQGFLKGAGLASVAEATIQKDPKKGDFYVALIEKPGRPAIDVLAEILPLVIRTFPWPKSMRWGERSARPGALAWVRPLHAIVATFGPETEEPDIVPFTVDGIAAGDMTRGHRFMAPQPFRIRRFDDYAPKLENAKVVLDEMRRKHIILTDAKHVAFVHGFELVEDVGLLDEVAGLVEWPVVLMGSFEAEFLAMPPEVIRTTIRVNQKCFVVRHPLSPSPGGGGSAPRTGDADALPRGGVRASATVPAGTISTLEGAAKQECALANRFILVANIEAADGGAAIIAGNERVIRARLADAKFFYDTDLKSRLEDRLPKFKDIVFHEKLGTQWERIARIERLAAKLAPIVGADVDKARRAARLAKADLLTDMVGEFPELQGLMGKYYARAQGEDESIATACEDHYKPLGPTDRVPTDPVAVAVALADKLDTLANFWAINEKPTGSKDPYALRRAALGVIRIVLENQIRIRFMGQVAPWIMSEIFARGRGDKVEFELQALQRLIQEGVLTEEDAEPLQERALSQLGPEEARRFSEATAELSWKIFSDLIAFFADRLKVQLREQGARHDLVDAVFALSTSPWRGEVGARSATGGRDGAESASGSSAHPTPAIAGAIADPPPPGEGAVQDDLLLIVRRVEALAQFLETEDGKNLLAGYKRAANIIRIEEKRDKTEYTGAPSPELYRQAEEWELARAIDVATAEASAAVEREDFAAAMRAMATLRPHVDAFFDKVTVNADEPDVRANRLALLNQIRSATRAVADFSRIEG